MDKWLRAPLLMVVLASLLSGCTQEPGKEDAARQVVDRMVVAANKLDTNEYALLLADDVKISIRSEENGQQRVIRPSKNQYLAMLSQARESIQDYNLSISDTQITMEGERALVTTQVNESMVVQGRMMNSRAREELTIEFRDGQPVVTEYVAYPGG